MANMPPRRSNLLKIHIRDLNATPANRYVDLIRERGHMVSIGKIDVDMEQIVRRRFLCDRHRCIQWTPHEKKDQARPIIDNSCCSQYVVPVTASDRQKVAEVLDLVRKRLPADHPINAEPDEPIYDIDEEYAHVMKTQENGACQFVLYEKGLTGCAIHKTCLEEGLDPWEYKPLTCSLWPLALVDYEDEDGNERYLLTIYTEATAGIFAEDAKGGEDDKKFACLLDQGEGDAYPRLYTTVQPVIEKTLGAAFYQKLDKQAKKYLAKA